MQILVTGAAGYIGSHIVKQLLDDVNYNQIIIIDNLSTGFIETIEKLQSIDHKNKIKFYKEDLTNLKKTEQIFIKHHINSIIHLAAYSQVGESIKKPKKYYYNNIKSTKNLINLAIKYNIKKFIFSSSASVYGNIKSENVLIKENENTNPISPYGKSKLISEKIIKRNIKKHPSIKYIILRYFNVSGADLTGFIGEYHEPETHLIPLVAKASLGKIKYINIFGDNYNTPDGTCIRDYIYVMDLSNIHILSLYYLDKSESDIFNCGYGKGFSVKEIIKKMQKVSNKLISIKIKNKRDGDSEILIADNSKLIKKMKWIPKYNDLSLICESTFNIEKI